jgi:GTP-sensing pleiotropic transcriptional regulator CodY
MCRRSGRDLLGWTKLRMSQINLVAECQVFTISIKGMEEGMILFRNLDTKRSKQKIGVSLLRRATSENLSSQLFKTIKELINLRLELQHQIFRNQDFWIFNQFNMIDEDLAMITKLLICIPTADLTLGK